MLSSLFYALKNPASAGQIIGQDWHQAALRQVNLYSINAANSSRRLQ